MKKDLLRSLREETSIEAPVVEPEDVAPEADPEAKPEGEQAAEPIKHDEELVSGLAKEFGIAHKDVVDTLAGLNLDLSQFDRDQLIKGAKDEFEEHETSVGGGLRTAILIAVDHLKKLGDHYDRIAKLEGGGETLEPELGAEESVGYSDQDFLTLQEELKANPPKDQVNEVAPEGWEPTVKAMKKHKDISNPWALAWYMKGKGMEPKKHKE